MNLAHYQHRLPQFKNVETETFNAQHSTLNIQRALFAHKKDSPDAPPPRDLASEIQQILTQGPAISRSQRELGPGFTGNTLNNLQLTLEGTPATGAEGGYWINSKTGQRSATAPTPGPFGLSQQGWQYVKPQAATPAQRGLLDIYRNDVIPAQTGAATATRTATYSDLRNLNPGQAGLLDTMTTQAQSELDAGSRLTPDEIYQATNPVKADWASRGFSAGTMPEGLDETLQLYEGGQNLLERRRRNATGTAALGSSLYTLPALGYGTGDAMNLMGNAQGFGGAGGNVFQQLGGYGSDLFNTNLNAQAAANTNQANANNATTSGLVTTGLTVALIA